MSWIISPPSILIIWLIFLLVVGVLRLNLLHRYERSSGKHEQAGFWLGWFIAGTAASGITWGLAPIILVPDRSIAHISFGLLWTAGLSAGTVAAYSVIKGAFLAFSLPALLLPALYLLIIGDKTEATMGTGTIMFFVFLSLNALRTHKTLMRELALRSDNMQLIKHLEKEKVRVDSINDQLEKRVAERTTALCESNAYLQKEIAERKRTEEALSQATAVFENTTEGAIITDTEDRIVAVNKAFTEITGYEQAEVVGKTPRVLHSGKHDEPFYTAISASITQTGRWSGGVWNRHKNGKIFPVWLNISTVVDDRDHFKNINDSLGHPAGDCLLQAVTERLLNSVRKEDTVARLGGDEFTVLLEDLRQSKDAGIVSEKALNVLAKPFDLDEHKAYVTASVGISLFPDDGQDVTTLLKNADSALYRAKEHGRNNYHFYTKDLTIAAFKRLTLESNLRRAVERGEFTLYAANTSDNRDSR
jgi:diguanylate cyclase (GGDEF)-like protein